MAWTARLDSTSLRNVHFSYVIACLTGDVMTQDCKEADAEPSSTQYANKTKHFQMTSLMCDDQA